MATCLIRNVVLHKKVSMSGRTFSLKFFSSFSPIYDKVSGINCTPYQCKYKKLNDPRQVQFRYSSTSGSVNFPDLISNSSGSKAVGDFLIQIHDSTGMPWWGTIISTAITMKLLINLPCGVCQQHVLSKLQLTKNELNATMKSIQTQILREGTKKKWSEQKVKSEIISAVEKQWKMLVVKNNCHPFKNIILFIFQFPFWFLITVAIRKLAMDSATLKMENPVSELQFLVGGPIWCQNLAAPDHTYILPALNAVAMLAMTEINVLNAQLKTAPIKQSFLLGKIVPNLLRLLAVVFFIVSSLCPSGISLFWATSSLFALCQNLLLMSPRMRRLLRIPVTPAELSKPYSQLWGAFCEKCLKLFFRK